MGRETLNGKRVAILATDGVEQVELTQPRQALEASGALTMVVSPKEGTIKGWQHDRWGDQIKVALTLHEARAEEFDALLIPGGVMNPDTLRMEKKAVDFVRAFFSQGKPVAAICHGPWLLVEAGVLRGRTVTSWPSLQTDIRNAGGDWVDREVVTDEGLVRWWRSLRREFMRDSARRSPLNAGASRTCGCDASAGMAMRVARRRIRREYSRTGTPPSSVVSPCMLL